MPARLTALASALLLTLAVAPATAAAAAAPVACTDFYSTVNSAWIAQNPLPAGSNHFSRWDQMAAIGVQQRDLMLAATTAPANAHVSTYLADLLASAQDEAAIEAAGTAPLQPLLAIVDKIRKTRDIAPAIAALHDLGLPIVVDVKIQRDAQGVPYAQIGPGGLGLPDASFLTSTSSEAAAVQLKYRAALTTWFGLAGVKPKDVAKQVEWATQMEMALAKATSAGGTPFQQMDMAQAVGVTGALELEKLLAARGLKASRVALTGPQFFAELNTQIANADAKQWQAYLRAQILREMAPSLGRAFHDPWAQLYDVTLAGQTAPTPRGVRARQVLEANMPEFLDAAYTERFVPLARQQRGQQIAEAVRTAAIAAVDRAAWLSAAGKADAKTRLQEMQIEVGRSLPDAVFAELKLSRTDLAGNILSLRRWLQKYALVRAQFAWPTEQWQPLVALLPQENRLVVSAATLQPPVLDDSGSASAYGSFGALVAQQVAVALQNWTGADATAWATRATPLIAQYDAYAAAGATTKVSGTRTFAQNQADLAGLEIAWAALNAAGPVDANAAKSFFTGWASIWARNDQPTALALEQATTLHAPSKWRVNGPLANLPAFGTAFACKAGPMQRAAKVQVALWR